MNGQSEQVDVAVVGIGAMGSAACWALARRGKTVVGIEQFDVGHQRGSSHGATRVIRKAYFEHPDYVPLLERAYAGWDALEQRTGERLFERTGIVIAGPADGAIVTGVKRSATEHHLSIEEMTPATVAERWPSWLALHPDDAVVFERDAGYLHVERSVRAMVRAARAAGASIRERTKILHWNADDDSVQLDVIDERGHASVIRARAMVLSAGSWTPSLFLRCESTSVRLQVRRAVQLWLPLRSAAPNQRNAWPVFGVERGGSFFYGFPPDENGLVKVAEHAARTQVHDPDKLDRRLLDADVAPISAFVQQHLPSVEHAEGAVVRHAACMYTMSADENFIVDCHPAAPHVAIAAGFSGHGFKFAPAVGELLAELVERPGEHSAPTFLHWR